MLLVFDFIRDTTYVSVIYIYRHKTTDFKIALMLAKRELSLLNIRLRPDKHKDIITYMQFSSLQQFCGARATHLNLDYMTTNKTLFPRRYVSKCYYVIFMSGVGKKRSTVEPKLKNWRKKIRRQPWGQQ